MLLPSVYRLDAPATAARCRAYARPTGAGTVEFFFDHLDESEDLAVGTYHLKLILIGA
jgi:hypothetical protein